MLMTLSKLTRSLVLLALAVAGSANATQSGMTPSGRSYLSGGVSDEERESLQAQQARYNLWIVTALRQSGEYLSAVRLKITDPNLNVVFDAALDGPWLLIDLPLGKYSIEAQLDGQSQQRQTTIHPGDHHQAIFYFGTTKGGGVSP
jgi:hypothetical protein